MRTIKSEAGNVIVEFIGITAALLVPLSIIAHSSITMANAYMSTDIAARTAARAFVVSNSDTSGSRAANTAATLAVEDFDERDSTLKIRISCSKDPCLSPGGFVTVRVSKEVRLNLPRPFGSRSVAVAAQHTSIVDELRLP